MKRMNLFISTLIVNIVFLYAFLVSSTATAAILPAPEKFSQHVYAWIGPLGGPSKENNGFRMNLGFVIGSNAIAVIDTGYTPMMAEEMLAHIRNISSLPIKYAINTNSQPHRFFGNDVFKRLGAELISSKEESSRMEKNSSNFAGRIERTLELPKGSIPIPALPSSQLSTPRQLDLGGRVKISLVPAGANHTPNSILVIISGDKMAFSGDILYGNRLLAITPDSNVKSWINVFESLKKYESYTFIPGHGKPGKLNAFQFPTYQYLSTLYTHMTNAIENDVSIDDAMARLDQSAFSKLENFKDLAGRNSSWTYLQAEQQAFE